MADGRHHGALPQPGRRVDKLAAETTVVDSVPLAAPKPTHGSRSIGLRTVTRAYDTQPPTRTDPGELVELPAATGPPA